MGNQSDGGVGNHSGGSVAGNSGGGVGGSVQGYLCEPACAEGQMCCPTGVHTQCVPLDEDGCNVPDLTIDDVAALNSLDIDWIDTADDPCLLLEACVGGPGLRRLLVFDTETPNLGSGDLIVGKPSMSNPDFEYSMCHGHYHFEGYAAYDLLNTDGEVVAAGHKQAYCLRDDNQVLFEADVRTDPYYSCSGVSQGISRGWSDVYYVGLDCQWVDITGVPPGAYVLRVRINPDRRIYELDYDNNDMLLPVIIP